MMRKVFIYLFTIIFFGFLLVSAKIRHIYESDGAQAIQDSIDVSGLYDTVMVHNGKYYIGDLSDSLGLQLKGSQLMSVSPDSAPYCILTGLSSSGFDTAIHVIWDTLGPIGWFSLIQGFTITEGKGFEWLIGIVGGGGIYIENWYEYYDLSLNIQNNIIKKNLGGIWISSSSGIVDINHNIIIDNKGTGIVGWASLPDIRNNIIQDNICNKDGGGILIESGLASSFPIDFDSKYKSISTIENNLIINNYAKEYGGGICLGYSVGAILNGNTIAFNVAGKKGGGLKCGSDWSSTMGENNIFAANISNKGGAIYAFGPSTNVNYTFAVDNASYIDSSGLLDTPHASLFMNYSNIYYNTYQQDIEAIVKSSANIENNFWGLTDSAKIDSIIDGDADFMPFMLGPVPDAPGEPVEIYSVLNYSNNYTSIIDSIGRDPDTLYLEITGHDNKHEFQEAAVAILKSKIYPTGVAVALLETDKSTGIYRGKAIVKTTNPPDSIRIDDMYQIIRVNPVADTVRIYANMDTTEMFKVYYRCQSGIEEDLEDEIYIESLQNPLTYNPRFRFYLPVDTKIELTIYDISGRVIDEVLSKELSSGWHTVNVDINKSGVYIYRMSTPFVEKSGKIVVIK
jgi:hypothetical protein